MKTPTQTPILEKNVTLLQTKIKENRELIFSTQRTISLNLSKEQSNEFDQKFNEIFQPENTFSSDIISRFSMWLLETLEGKSYFDADKDLFDVYVEIQELYESKVFYKEPKRENWLNLLKVVSAIETDDESFDAANTLFAHILINSAPTPLTADFKSMFLFAHSPYGNWQDQAEMFLELIEQQNELSKPKPPKLTEFQIAQAEMINSFFKSENQKLPAKTILPRHLTVAMFFLSYLAIDIARHI